MPDSARKPDTREIAIIGEGRDITRGFVDQLPLLEPQDEILTLEGNGELEVYEEIYQDWDVFQAFTQRQLAVISREWAVKPGGEGRKDKIAADHLREVLQDIPFDEITKKMLFGVYYGYAVAECLWAVREGRIVPQSIPVRNRKRFRFDTEKKLRLITMANPVEGEPLPPRKFWVFSTGADNDDDPYGRGLAHWLYWPVFFRRGGVEFWLKLLDRFAVPTAIGEYSQKEDEPKLYQALVALQNSAAVTIPEGTKIMLLEATRTGDVKNEAFQQLMSDAITKIILGQTASSSGTPGKLGDEKLQSTVREDIVKSDADLLCASFNNQVVAWMTEWNFPGARPPQVWRVMEQPDDLDEISARDERIRKLGYRPTQKYINDTYGEGWEPDNAATRDASPEEPTGKEEKKSKEFSAPDNAPARESDSTDAQLRALRQTGGRAVAGMTDKIEALLGQVGSLAEFRGRLQREIPGMDKSAFANAMGQAVLAAHMAGRYDILQGGPE
uniref:Mu-like prophage protein gp29 n=1 Tax=Candidatus Kentrum sp. UNK TaxID=2126344 RepID=A0A451AQL0_9GAMM|nr:MAG: Mu-like prophage protein gp29 [Candidatus Kentron sp. UNK]VFK68317.1 MAG: Mu-like prophage protein gp29 [Candidatus Kentron sp. UNK]